MEIIEVNVKTGERITRQMTQEEIASIQQTNEDQLLSQSNARNLSYLASTDWYVIRFADSGVPIPDDIKAARQAARDAIA